MCNHKHKSTNKTYTVSRRLSERQLSETSINRTSKETAHAYPFTIFCMFTIAASTVRNVRRLWKASEWLKNQRKKSRTVIFIEKKLRFVSVEEVELALKKWSYRYCSFKRFYSDKFSVTNREEKFNSFVGKIESIA